MPWTDLKPRKFPAFDKQLDGISKETMADHYKLYEGYAKKANECRKLLNEFDYAQIEGNQVYSPLRAVSVDYTFALLGFAALMFNLFGVNIWITGLHSYAGI